jgi:hypothetical protein
MIVPESLCFYSGQDITSKMLIFGGKYGERPLPTGGYEKRGFLVLSIKKTFYFFSLYFFFKDAKNEFIKNFQHWLVVNIPGNNLQQGTTKRYLNTLRFFFVLRIF